MASKESETTNESSNIIRPLSEIETNQFLEYYKDLLLNSVNKKCGLESEELYEKIKKLSYVHNKIDPKCCMKINKRLVRIEYPGNIKNIDKAIQTLGGLEDIEANVGDQKKRLEVRFHANNRYNKPVYADKDFKPGILIKVKSNAGSSISVENPENYIYEVIGVSVMNFSFNRMCDFQYLPLVAAQPETKTSKTEFVYEKILPKNIPDTEWFAKEELKNMDPFLLPLRFSHYDTPHVKLNFDNTFDRKDDLSNDDLGLVAASKAAAQKRKKICKIFGKKQQLSIFVDFKDKEIPKKPLESTVKFITGRFIDEEIGRVKQLFEERPIWTKSAVLYNTGITTEHSKYILPIVAYFFNNGPWRNTWVKYGYDPRADPQARIYQTLDYRIRTADSIQLKVNTKRTYATKWNLTVGPSNTKKISLKDDISTKPRPELDERCYVLRPLTIPPARQLFYQFCDIILPEIQDKLIRVSTYGERTCDPKYGWLSKKFIDDCRETVNTYVLQAVQVELLKDNQMMQEKVSKVETKKSKGSSLDYCQQMLSKVKKGIYKGVHLNLPGPSLSESDLGNVGDDIEMISLSDDDDDYTTVGDIIQESLPANIENEDIVDDEDSVSQSSDDGEIDMEVVDEINKLIKQSTSS